MIETPQITQSSEQLTAGIPLVVPRAEIQQVMGPAISEVYRTLAAQGIAPAGPWFTHHVTRPTDVFDFEACVPVGSVVSEMGRVKPGRLAATRVARTVYQGPYEGLCKRGESSVPGSPPTATPRADLWECYLVGPESSPDPKDWRTELNQPLAD